MPPPEPIQPPGQEELERRIPGYRRIVIPRELTLIELLVGTHSFFITDAFRPFRHQQHVNSELAKYIY